MTLVFQINYRTAYGETLCVIETKESLLGWTEVHPLRLSCQGTDFWTCREEVTDFQDKIAYKYAVLHEDGTYTYELGTSRQISLGTGTRQLVVRDVWQGGEDEDVFCSKTFADVLFKRQSAAVKKASAKWNIRFSIRLPQIRPTEGLAVMGNIPELGEWNPQQMLCLDDGQFPLWSGCIFAKDPQVVEYKYCIYDLQTGVVRDLEYGDNRQIWGWQKGLQLMLNDAGFRRTQPRWKGAGVAVPLSALRTENDLGIGEYPDLKLLADWAHQTGQKMIQLLPIQDTTLTHTNRDSYPYNAVSVMALHPIYLNVLQMGELPKLQQQRYHRLQAEWKKSEIADYQTVYDAKTTFFLSLYRKEGKKTLETKECKVFADKNAEWLQPYAKFMSKRDGYAEGYYIFLQYHADLQLREAILYAHAKGVAIKGDIPIGISPDSVDATFYPHLFHLNASAGAPPDDFSLSGQNWGFPTYRWEKMAEDGYAWWRMRLGKMQDYFDAYRIDHILGFFRIWQMRKADVWGLCGHFQPALPYSLAELREKGVTLDEDRMTRPYIREHFLGEVLGKDVAIAKRWFLQTNDGQIYFFRREVDTQKKIAVFFEQKGASLKISRARLNALRDGLFLLTSEVLFVRDQQHPEMLHPRICMLQSFSYRELSEDQRHVLEAVYNDYFYHRHTWYWRESAMKKLPALLASNRMLCCGEDLGMVPACVPEVMRELRILSLEIQRMPKNPNARFAHPQDAPYLSVCTTGTHDMNPLRAWWEEDRETAQRFWKDQLAQSTIAPRSLSPRMAEEILVQHLFSPAMWVIFPIQDWLAIDGKVRRTDYHNERINVPSNPHHFWNYRMHLSLEQLLKEDALNNKIRKLTQIR